MTEPAKPPNPPRPSSSRRGLWSLVLVVLAAGALAEGARAWIQQQRAEALRAVARPGDLRMISSESCVFCAQARAWMTRERLPFEECFVERDARCAADYDRLGRPGTPTLLVRGHAQLGFDPERITAALSAERGSQPR
jgi:glutaredoxin